MGSPYETIRKITALLHTPGGMTEAKREELAQLGQDLRWSIAESQEADHLPNSSGQSQNHPNLPGN